MLEGKVKCIESEDEDIMIFGKVYEFINGKFIREDGLESGIYSCVKDFNLSNITKIEPYGFTKSDLKDGDYVELKNGDEFIISIKFGLMFRCTSQHILLEYYNKDLKNKYLDTCDIVKIERDGKIIWEREEKSQRDIEIDYIQAQMKELSKKLDELRKMD